MKAGLTNTWPAARNGASAPVWNTEAPLHSNDLYSSFPYLMRMGKTMLIPGDW
jgi:hypothetical protein